MNDRPAVPATGLHVRDIMRTDIVSVTPETTVRELVRSLAERRIGGVPVLNERGELVGIVTTTDLVRLAADAAEVPLAGLLDQVTPPSIRDEADGLLSFLSSDAWGDAESLAPVERIGTEGGMEYEEYRVADIMRPAQCTVAPDEPLNALARRLLESHVHRAPVIEQGRLVGIVTTFDILRAVAGGMSVPTGRGGDE